jgi:hypothetical protein
MKTKLNKFEHEADWPNWIGKEVIKHSKKPFKSKQIIETVIGLTTNPNSNKQAFKLNDGSVVDCHQCQLYN